MPELSGWLFSEATAFMSAMSEAGITPSVARMLMEDPEGMGSWIASAPTHLSEYREAQAARQARLRQLTLDELFSEDREFSEFAMSVRVYNCLKRAGANTVEDITTLEERPRHLDDKSLAYLQKLLMAADLTPPAWLTDQEPI